MVWTRASVFVFVHRMAPRTPTKAAATAAAAAAAQAAAQAQAQAAEAQAQAQAQARLADFDCGFSLPPAAIQCVLGCGFRRESL